MRVIKNSKRVGNVLEKECKYCKALLEISEKDVEGNIKTMISMMTDECKKYFSCPICDHALQLTDDEWNFIIKINDDYELDTNEDIVLSLTLEQWLFIAHEIGFYGSDYSLNDSGRYYQLLNDVGQKIALKISKLKDCKKIREELEKNVF